MWYDREISYIARMLVFWTLLIQSRNLRPLYSMSVRDIWRIPTDRIAHSVAQMNTSVAKADACEGRSESIWTLTINLQMQNSFYVQHLPTSLAIIWVFGYAREIGNGSLKCPKGKYVGDRVASLVRRSEDWVGGAWGTFRISV